MKFVTFQVNNNKPSHKKSNSANKKKSGKKWVKPEGGKVVKYLLLLQMKVGSRQLFLQFYLHFGKFKLLLKNLLKSFRF